MRDELSDEHEDRHPGAHARQPSGIPWRGWWQVLVRAVRRSSQDRVPLLGAGVAFFGFLALMPTLIAAVLVYGLVADPTTINRHIEAVAEILPDAGTALVSDQMESLAAADRQGLSIGLVAAVLVALWSASVGVAHLITAVNLAYEEREPVSFVRRRLMALVFTLGAILTFTVLVGLAAVFPAVMTAVGAPSLLLQIGRWATLLVVSVAALSVIYRYAPRRRHAEVPWVSVGAIVATAIWALASAGLSLYVSLFGNYSETYGALAGVVIVLVWMWLTSMAVLLGAEINAEAEHQTDADTTVGPDQPRGSRGAVKADAAVGRPVPGTTPAATRTRRG